VPGAAEAVKRAGRQGVKVLGLSTPNASRAYIQEGWVESIVIWKAPDLGYLTVCAGQALATGALAAGQTLIDAGRLGKLFVFDDEVRLGRPHIYTKANIDQVSF
jgi:ABC-type sugar transport system substrate-binding protein